MFFLGFLCTCARAQMHLCSWGDLCWHTYKDLNMSLQQSIIQNTIVRDATSLSTRPLQVRIRSVSGSLDAVVGAHFYMKINSQNTTKSKQLQICCFLLFCFFSHLAEKFPFPHNPLGEHLHGTMQVMNRNHMIRRSLEVETRWTQTIFLSKLHAGSFLLPWDTSLQASGRDGRY
jgi:hypothetical protein